MVRFAHDPFRVGDQERSRTGHVTRFSPKAALGDRNNRYAHDCLAYGQHSLRGVQLYVTPQRSNKTRILHPADNAMVSKSSEKTVPLM